MQKTKNIYNKQTGKWENVAIKNRKTKHDKKIRNTITKNVKQ